MTRLLGIDLGLRRIGLAVADLASGQVAPLATIRRAAAPEQDGKTIARLAREQAVDELVVGLPLNMDGTMGGQALATRAWTLEALAGVALPVCFRDERLTTERAQARIGGPGRGRSGGPPSPRARRTHRAQLDREAAAWIAQAEMDERLAVSRGG